MKKILFCIIVIFFISNFTLILCQCPFMTRQNGSPMNVEGELTMEPEQVEQLSEQVLHGVQMHLKTWLTLPLSTLIDNESEQLSTKELEKVTAQLESTRNLLLPFAKSQGLAQQFWQNLVLLRFFAILEALRKKQDLSSAKVLLDRIEKELPQIATYHPDHIDPLMLDTLITPHIISQLRKVLERKE